jgi:hypothetical protein
MIARDTAVLNAATDYTDQKISDLVGGAPALLDTLRELASAIGDDESFVVTMANNYATLSSALVASEQAADGRLDVLESAVDSLTGASGVTVLGTIAAQNYDSVNITGGSMLNVTISAAAGTMTNYTLVDCSLDAGTF